MKASDRDEQELAITHLRNAVSIDPEFYRAINNLGAIYLITGKLDLASEQLEKAIATDPRMSWAYTNLSLVYLRRGDFKQGELIARQGLAVDSSCTRGMLSLGMALVLQNKFTVEAERLLRRAASDFPQAKFWHGIVLVEEGDIQAAENQLTEYIGSGDRNAVRIDTAQDLVRRIVAANDTRDSGGAIRIRFRVPGRDTF